MRRLSLRRVFGGFLIFSSAMILGLTLTPQEGTAQPPAECLHEHCVGPVGGEWCDFALFKYCHRYEFEPGDIECFDGYCQ